MRVSDYLTTVTGRASKTPRKAESYRAARRGWAKIAYRASKRAKKAIPLAA